MIESMKIGTTAHRATYRDVLDAPSNVVAEIVDGKLYIHRRPSPQCLLASSRLARRIGAPFDFHDGGPGGWWILSEPELHLGEDVVVPDIAGWRRETMPEIPDEDWFSLAPDWVCEVLSDSTRKLDRGGKQMVYAKEGVEYLWFVDPNARSLETLKLEGAKWKLIDELFNDAPVALSPFKAVSFNLGNLWPPPATRREKPVADLE